MVNESRLVGLFKELCLIDAPARGERSCADRVIAELRTLGLDVWEDDAHVTTGGNCGNVIAKVPGNKAGAKSIFLSAHIDTVEPTAGLVIGEKDGVLFSESDTILGADDKGGLAPIIEAVRMLQETGAQHGDIHLLFSVCEEVGLLGAGHLDIQSLNVDFGYVFDTGPPVGSFVTKTATHDNLDVTVFGIPAHAGKDPEKGVNAIQVVASAISCMALGRIGPETTANFGLIEGGTAVNVVCPFVKLRGEARSTDLVALDAQVAHMRQCFEDAAAEWGAKVEVVHDRHYGAYEIPSGSVVVKVAQQAARKLGFDGHLRTTLGGSDANQYNTKGVPTIVVATGMDKIHTHDEFIAVKDLVATANLAYEIVLAASSV